MQLVYRLFRTEWRSGDLRLLFAALLLAVTVTTALTAFVERMQVMLVGESSQFLAADRVLEAPRPVDESWLQTAQDKGLEQARFLGFQSMLYAGDTPQLVSAKAADNAYPLRGQLQYRETLLGTTIQTTDGPRPGEVWAEARLFSLLDLKIGDQIELGDGRFTLSAELVSEPDRGAGYIGLGPRVLMHWDDIEKTGVVQIGSRLSYHYLFAGEPSALAELEQALLPQFTDSHEWKDLENAQPTVALALHRAKVFFMLASSIVVILAGIAIAMASSRFSQRHMRYVAVLKTLGATSHTIRRLYLQLLVCLGLAAVLFGWLAAFLLQHIAVTIASNMLNVDAPAPGVWPFVLGLLVALVSLLAFSLPPLLRLGHVSALSIFQQQQTDQHFSLKGLVAALAGLTILLMIYTGAPVLGLLLLGGLLLLVLAVSLPAAWLLRHLRPGHIRLSGWPALAISNLQRRLRSNALHVALFAISMMLLVVLLGVKDNLFYQWQRQLPPQTPNFFIVNIYEHDLESIREWLDDADIQTEKLYPMVRGRLVQINGEPVRQLVSKEDLQRAGADRELNLSWAEELPPDNTLVDGDWWNEDSLDDGVSVESQLAERLNIGLGDELTFMIEAQSFTTTVSNLREVEWDRMRPNFYMLFREGQLDGFAKTYMTSFWLPKERHPEVSELLREFPTAVVIELDAVIQQIRGIIGHVSIALQVVLFFVVVASLLVLMTTVQNGLAQRMQENTVIRALGGTRRLIAGSLLAEFALMGLLAGILATVFAQIVLLLVQAKALQMSLQLNPELWWQAPVAGMLLIGSAGFWSARKVTRVSPMQLLRESE